MSKKNALKLFIIFVFFFIMFIWIVSMISFKRINILCIVTFFINGLIWFYMLIKEIKKSAYSLAIIHWFFCLFFYFVAALAQFASDKFPWIGYRSNDVIFEANILLLIWTFFFCIGRHISHNKEIFCSFFSSDYYPSKNKMALITIGSVFILLNRIIKIGVTGLFMKSVTNLAQSDINDSAKELLLEKILVSYCCLAAVISIYVSKEIKEYKIFAIINIICLFFAYFPPILSRNVVATVYGSLLLVLFPKLKKSRAFVVLFSVAFLIIFPFFDVFRYNDFKNINLLDTLKNTIENIAAGWTEGHYDAYTTYSLTLDYVRENGITWGRQLLGVLFFFIPRSFWPSKPIGSGAFMAERLGTFTNISCSLPGEGYINWGIIGLILFGLFLGMISQRIDNTYWDNSINSYRIETLYPILIFMFFFMCRGDLLSSFAYLCAFIFVWFFMMYDFNLLKK